MFVRTQPTATSTPVTLQESVSPSPSAVARGQGIVHRSRALSILAVLRGPSRRNAVNMLVQPLLFLCHQTSTSTADGVHNPRCEAGQAGGDGEALSCRVTGVLGAVG